MARAPKPAPVADEQSATAAPAAPKVAVSLSVDDLLALVADQGDRVERSGIRIAGPRKGRRRAGRAFGPQAIIVPLVNLGEDELRAIDSDPELSWSLVELAEDEGDRLPGDEKPE